MYVYIYIYIYIYVYIYIYIYAIQLCILRSRLVKIVIQTSILRHTIVNQACLLRSKTSMILGLIVTIQTSNI